MSKSKTIPAAEYTDLQAKVDALTVENDMVKGLAVEAAQTLLNIEGKLLSFPKKFSFLKILSYVKNLITLIDEVLAIIKAFKDKRVSTNDVTK